MFPSNAQMQQYDAMPIGAVVQSLVNLEAISGGRWLCLDGRSYSRNLLGSIASRAFPTGAMTSIMRTLQANPNTSTIAADGTVFLVPGATGSSPLQASGDNGTTWTLDAATWAAGTQAINIIVAGSRFVMQGLGADLGGIPAVANTGQTATNIVKKSSWSFTTGVGVTLGVLQGMAYSPQLGMTALIPTGSGNTIYTLADGATAWVSRTLPSTQTKYAICWTGQKFAVANVSANILTTTTDGATWVDNYIPLITTASNQPSMASDGRGTIVANFSNNANMSLYVSHDHGATWQFKLLPLQLSVTNGAQVRYVNDRFLVTMATWAMLTSKDGDAWFVEPIASAGGDQRQVADIAYQNGVWCGVKSGTVNALTATEDMSKVRLTASWRGSGGYPSPSYAEYIKVA